MSELKWSPRRGSMRLNRVVTVSLKEPTGQLEGWAVVSERTGLVDSIFRSEIDAFNACQQGYSVHPIKVKVTE